MKGIPNIAGIDIPSLIGNVISYGGAVLINAVFDKRWGIMDESGAPILIADSVATVSFDSSSSISSMPVEKGTFVSYNKVSNPRIATVQLNKSSGGALARGAFLTTIETLENSTRKVHVITPEYVHMNYQIIGSSTLRSAQDGHTLIKVNIDLQEIREANVDYENEEVTNPSDSRTEDGGQKQSTEAPANSVLYEALGKILGR